MQKSDIQVLIDKIVIRKAYLHSAKYLTSNVFGMSWLLNLNRCFGRDSG